MCIILTCTSHCGWVFDSPVEAFFTVTDSGGLVMAGAMQRTLGTFSVPGKCLEEARPTCWRKIITIKKTLVLLTRMHFHQHT